MDRTVSNLDAKFASFDARWSPKRVARLNDYDVRLVKIEGAFVWHAHAETDELFLVWKGAFRMEYRDRTVELSEGDLHVVPKGVEHRPVADAECWVVLIEPGHVVNTGTEGGPMTAAVEEI